MAGPDAIGSGFPADRPGPIALTMPMRQVLACNSALLPQAQPLGGSIMVHHAGSPDARASTGLAPVPAGDYRASIVGAAIGDVSRRSHFGRCLTLTWQIEAGPFDDRLIAQRLNLWAENMRNLDKVIAIANAQFAAIRVATGRPVPRDVDELRNIACRIKVGIASDPAGQYAPRNEVRAVRAAGGVAGMPV